MVCITCYRMICGMSATVFVVIVSANVQDADNTLTLLMSANAQEACSLAQRCLRRAQQRGASRHTAAKVAASVLTRAAIDQGSSDNVTVVVVDLSRHTQSLHA